MINVECDICKAVFAVDDSECLVEHFCESCKSSNWILMIGKKVTVFGDKNLTIRRNKVAIEILSYMHIDIPEDYQFSHDLFNSAGFDEYDRAVFSLLFEMK